MEIYNLTVFPPTPGVCLPCTERDGTGVLQSLPPAYRVWTLRSVLTLDSSENMSTAPLVLASDKTSLPRREPLSPRARHLQIQRCPKLNQPGPFRLSKQRPHRVGKSTGHGAQEPRFASCPLPFYTSISQISVICKPSS